MAKGLEDTCFYNYNRLVSLNEVGGDPGRFGITPDQLHRWNIERAARFPHALTPLSTHDTKRSEDVRARINVLSEVPDRWFQALERWNELNQRHKRQIDDKDAPDRNEEYFFYQNLLGAWPLEDLDEEAFSAFRDRIRAYMAKSIHEAKVHSSWQNPDPEYDEAIDHFVLAVLDRVGNQAFLDDFLAFQRFVSHHGMINSLAQTLLKIGSPGVPDTYQGTELWDFSLVDPDNRRPVDYDRRSSMLKDLMSRQGNPAELVRDLVASCRDGRIKLYTHWRALAARREVPGLFSTGEYRPLPARGKHESSLFGFLRSGGFPRGGRGRAPPDNPPGHQPIASRWARPPGKTRSWSWPVYLTARSSATSSPARVSRPRPATEPPIIKAGDLFADFPVALLLERVTWFDSRPMDHSRVARHCFLDACVEWRDGYRHPLAGSIPSQAPRVVAEPAGQRERQCSCPRDATAGRARAVRYRILHSAGARCTRAMTTAWPGAVPARARSWASGKDRGPG